MKKKNKWMNNNYIKHLIQSPKDVVEMRAIGRIKIETDTHYCAYAIVEYTYRDGSKKIEIG